MSSAVPRPLYAPGLMSQTRVGSRGDESANGHLLAALLRVSEIVLELRRKNPAKDRDHRNTLRIKGWLAGRQVRTTAGARG